MVELLRHSRHIVRAAAIVAVGILAFVVARAYLIPAGFGTYGHYRAGAIEEAREHEPRFAGHAACEECHDDVVQARKGSRHDHVRCEACHGALAGHAADPGALKPSRPDADRLCLVCHLANVAKPNTFPQIDPKDHADGSACGSCHRPHHPEST